MHRREGGEGLQGLLLQRHQGRHGRVSVSTLRERRGDDLQGCDDTPPPTPHFSCHRPHRQQALERALGVVFHLAVVRVAVVAVRPATRTAMYLDGDPTRILMTTRDGKMGDTTR